MIDTLRLSNQLFQYKLDGLRDNIILSNQVSDVIQKHLAIRPFRLNVIEAACHGRFKETGHSLVLADMLKHPKIQASFLERFLGIQHDFMKVTAEKDRVDVALKGEDIFIIVENKVNSAGEQENQVYRYVHEIGEDKYGYDLSQIYVVYLNPTDQTLPSDYSLCDENGENNVFEAIGEDHYVIQSYKYDITSWLRRLSIEGEPHINSALDQYIDFLETKFHNSPLDKNMNNEIKQLILKELAIEGKSFEEQMDALNSQSKKVAELSTALEELKIELKKAESHRVMREWQNHVAQKLNIELKHDEHSFGILLKNNVWLGIWDGYDDKKFGYKPYWGVQCDSYKPGNMPEIEKQIEELLKIADIRKSESENGWIAFYTTQKGVERFISLYNAAKSLMLI